ncbi:MAG: protein kinase [Planctomycetaceae bacterium]|nr:protein kinase [Planctomycetaceae bacterium]
MAQPKKAPWSQSNLWKLPLTSDPQARLWKLATFVLAIGMVFTLFVGWLTYRVEGRQKTAEFERLADHLTQVAENNFEATLEVFRSLPQFFEASEQVTRKEFNTFVLGALQRHDGIYAFQWIPLVDAEKLPDLVRSAHAEGQPDFEIRTNREYADDQVVEQRAEYMPILYEQPLRFNVGLDLLTDKWRAGAIKQALDSGNVAVSGRLVIPSDGGDMPGVALYMPVGRGEWAEGMPGYQGVVAVTLLIDPIMDEVLNGNYMQGTRVILAEDATADPGSVLFENAHPTKASPLAGNLRWEDRFSIGNQEWMLRVIAETGSDWNSRTIAWFVLAAGTIASFVGALGTVGLGTILGLRQRVEAAVELGQYKLEEKIGEGGMGEVYRASHAMLRRPTAVKLLRAKNNTSAAISRFEREVQSTSQLVHPNTIVIFDYGRTPDGTFYYAMEYLEGVDLGHAVDFSGAMPAARVIHLLLQVCGSLHEAHEAGLVHRDIKPPNIMLCQRGGQTDIVKVLDFGLVKDVAERDGQVTQVNAITGTPLYMSPEAISNSPAVDARSDLYSLGAVGYLLLGGQPLFAAKNAVEVMHAHLHTKPEPLSEKLGRPVAADLEAVIMACLEKDPARRPQSAEELTEALRSCKAFGQWSTNQALDWWRRYKVCKSDSHQIASTATETKLDLTVEIDLTERA